MSAERRVQNQLHNAPLLVRKERGQRVVHVAVVAVKQPNHLGEIGALHVLCGLAGKSLEGGRVLRVIALHGCGNVLIAKVQHGKGEALLIAGNCADNLDPAQRQPSPAGGVNVVGVAPDTEAEQVGLLGKGGKDGADSVVRRHLLQAQLLGVDLLFVDVWRRRRPQRRWSGPRPGAPERPVPAARPASPKTSRASCSTRAA